MGYQDWSYRPAAKTLQGLGMELQSTVPQLLIFLYR